MAIKAADMREFTYLSAPKVNPCRDTAAFVVTRADYDNNKYINKLYLHDGFELKPLTEAGSERSFIWEDDNNILFRTAKKERYLSQSTDNNSAKDAPCSHFYRIAIDGGEAAYAFSIPLSVDDLIPLNEPNKFLVTASYDLACPDLWQKDEEERQKIWNKLQKRSWHEEINEIPFQSNGISGYTHDSRSAIFIFDAVSEELELLGDDYPNWQIEWLRLNTAKNKALFAAIVYEGANEFKMPLYPKLYEADLENGTINCLYDKEDHQLGFGFYIETVDENLHRTGNEAIILISADTVAYGINENNYFYQYNPFTKSLVKIDNHEIQYGSSVGSDARYGGSNVKNIYKGHFDLIETKRTDAVLNRYYFIEPEISVDSDSNNDAATATCCAVDADTCENVAANNCENTELIQDVSRETFKQLQVAQELLLAGNGSIDAFFNLNVNKDEIILANNTVAYDCCDKSDEYECESGEFDDCECEDCECEDCESEYETCDCEGNDCEDCNCDVNDTHNASNDETTFVIALFDNNLPEIYIADAADKPLRLTYFNDIESLYSTQSPQYFSIKSRFDGETIDGGIILPANFDSNKPAAYPLILDIHGGPKTVYGSVYYHEMQVWAAMGFVVCFANPHGSDGKGNAFSDIRGAFGTRDYDDLMDFVDAVLAKYPAIDAERLGVTGGSYGGFMTNWITSHTDRFKVAATQRSISNWLSFYGTSDIGYYFSTDQNNVRDFSPASMEKLWQHSPLKYVNNVNTPTLIIHSDEDYRCPLEQGLQWYTALKARNIPSKLAVFHGENHELSRSGKPQAREQRLNLLSHWFVKYLQADKTELLAELERDLYE